MVCFWYYDLIGADIIREIQDSQSHAFSSYEIVNPRGLEEKPLNINHFSVNSSTRRQKTAAGLPPGRPLPSSQSSGRIRRFPSFGHPCDHFAFPPPPPADRRRTGPRRKFDAFFWILFSILNLKSQNIISIVLQCDMTIQTLEWLTYAIEEFY